jgi:hypothetical protein
MDPAVIVYLNVGGVYFVTRRDTLTTSGSFFSGIANSYPECSELFIDRDPTHFRHILNWLRGVRHLPEDEMTLRELLWEADYYSMSSMHDAIIRTRERYSLHKSMADISKDIRQR